MEDSALDARRTLNVPFLLFPVFFCSQLCGLCVYESLGPRISDGDLAESAKVQMMRYGMGASARDGGIEEL